MKTNKLPDKKHRFELWLTIAGWSLAVFVSLLYLAEIRAQRETSPVPIEPTSMSSSGASDRISVLLDEARSFLESRRPEEAINRITTLWSVCHSSQQLVPEESHQLFAEAVSAMSHKTKTHPLRPPLEKILPRESRPELEHPIEKLESKARTVKKVKVKRPNIELPERNYPKASAKRSQPHDRSHPKTSRPDRHRYKSPTGHPAPPPPYQARQGRGSNPFPVRLSRSGRPLPPDRRRTGSQPRNHRSDSPLEGRDGGRPPGY